MSGPMEQYDDLHQALCVTCGSLGNYGNAQDRARAEMMHQSQVHPAVSTSERRTEEGGWKVEKHGPFHRKG